ncbi:MAG: sulfatase-like hydrolase/transferase, partial [Verrucomicrobiota bacterium]
MRLRQLPCYILGVKAIFLFFCISLGIANAAPKQPNIVLIMADDIGIEGLSCYGGESYQTPNLDKLAAEGMRFTHAYSQPLCTPTRVQIMTGKYNHRNWLYFGTLDPKERTFGHLMQSAGYKTCIAGKWQLQSYDPPDFPGGEKRRGLGMKVTDAGFDDYALFHSWDTEDKGSRYGHPTYDENGVLTTVKGGYGPDSWTDFILDFMKANKGQPQFVYYPMALPHWPVNPTPDSDSWSNLDRRLEDDPRYFKDMVHYMDKVVGQIADGIDKLGMRENTLILFYSDNGTDAKVTSQFRGTSVQGGKATPNQTGIRVPLIANWRGTISADQETDALIDASDFLPTFAQLSGANIPDDWHTDGQSFASTLLGEKSTPRDHAFFWYDPRPGWDKERFRRHIFALDHDYKLFQDGRFYQISGDGLREDELDNTQLTDAQKAAKAKLSKAIKEN